MNNLTPESINFIVQSMNTPVYKRKCSNCRNNYNCRISNYGCEDKSSWIPISLKDSSSYSVTD